MRSLSATELIDQKVKMVGQFRNNRLNKKKGRDAVLTVKELFGKLLVGDELGVLGIWQCEGQKFERTRKLIGHSHAIKCCLIVDLQHGIIASSSSGELNSIRVWNSMDGMCLATLKHHRETVSALACLRGAILVSASYDGQICIWDLAKKQLLREVDAHGYPILCMEKSFDEKYIVTGGDDYFVRIWQTENFNMVGMCMSETGSITSLCMLAGQRLAMGTSGGQIKVFSLEIIQAGKVQRVQFKIAAHKEAVTGMTYLPRKNWLVSVSEDRSLKLWQAKLGTLMHSIPLAHPDSIACVTHSLDQTTLVSGCWDGLIRLWQLA